VTRSIEVLAATGRPVRGANILVLGVAYKPGVSDVRESPALDIMSRLRAAGARISFSDEFVDRIHIDGEELRSVSMPQNSEWDLVIVHTIHPRGDLSWLANQRAVLDTTYRLPPGPNHNVL
jgi:UDP-N-acetyl-D-mannosaminuronate dehydrogenase